MSLISCYLNQSAQLERYLRDDDYGEPVFAAPQAIKCRKQMQRDFDRTARGDSVLLRTIYYTEVEVAAGDRIDGAIVAKAEAMVNLPGVAVGYKVIM